MNRTSPSRSFDIPTTKLYMKEGRFGENAASAICGSDHGKIYVFDINTGERKQTLRHGDSKAISLSGGYKLTFHHRSILDSND